MGHTFYARVGKRCFDVLLSSVGLVLLSPLLLLVSIAVRLTSPGPALFRQLRSGRLKRPFRILKFRTMRSSGSSQGSLLTASGDARITPLGRWLRKTKIDELPQLFNVFAGDMSLVGPRPEVPRYTQDYSDSEDRVFGERPGITGPSIILNEEELMAGHADKEGFYLSTILPAKLKIDLAYCADVSFWNDLRVLMRTVKRLLLRPAPNASPTTAIQHLAAPVGGKNQKPATHLFTR